MGGGSCKGAGSSDKQITIAILGLDNAGKTTTARVLEKAPVDSVAPTIGFQQSEITHKNDKIKLIDLGGAKTFRDAWRHYYDDAYGFVYVLDSAEENRLSENRDVLKRLLQEEKVKGKPILILANKQDKAEALDKNAILEDLRIERLVNENQTLCRVELCTAKSMNRNGKASKIDESIRHGFDWLIKTIYEHRNTLDPRVQADVKKRDEAEKIAKRERQERVRKLREEREKEEGTQNNNDDDDDTMKNGFVPINQAVKNAQRNTSEKLTKDKTNNEKSKNKLTNENTSLPPKPAPRSFSQSRRLIDDENGNHNDSDQERPRRFSQEIVTKRKESPIPRSVSTNFDENEQANSDDEQISIQALKGKKKKVIGAGRQRLQGDNLPPLAPSAAAARRDDLTQSKGPPVGTPRPPATVAQWAITSPTPHSTAEKLTTIASDNELDNDEKKSKSLKPSKRIVSPHPVTTNRITHEKKPQSTTTNNNDDDNDNDNDYRKSSRRKRNDDTNNNDDDDNQTNRRSTSVRKSHSKFNDINDDDDEIGDNQKKTNSRDENPYPKQRYNRNNDNNDENQDEDSNKRASSSARKTAAGDSSHRSHSRNNGHINDDDDLR